MPSLSKPKFMTAFSLSQESTSRPKKVDALGSQYPQYSFDLNKAKIIDYNQELATELSLDENDIQHLKPLLLGSEPSPHSYSYNYGGHQFGHWADQLGDGRAIVIGSLLDKEKNEHEIQLKGSGPTPFSRRGDGFAVLRSSVREYLASEALHQLGIPTTRALSLGLSGEKVLRDKFYDGNAKYETGAIVARSARSFIRFGNFELLASRNKSKELKDLLIYVIDEFYPQINSKSHDISQLAPMLLKEVLIGSSKLVASWQSIGFTHGVLNSDNMSIISDTIDYGPYGFLENFDTSYTPNTSDLPGRRYAFGRQPQIVSWNLSCLASAFLSISSEESLVEVLKEYEDRYSKDWSHKLREKFGYTELQNPELKVIERFFDLMEQDSLDMTYIFRQLSESIRDTRDEVFLDYLPKSFSSNQIKDWSTWYETFKKTSLGSQQGEKMCRVNPRIVLKNHTLHQAIEGLEQGDSSIFNQLKAMIMEPYQDWQGQEKFFAPAPDWAQSKDIQMNSCSS